MPSVLRALILVVTLACFSLASLVAPLNAQILGRFTLNDEAELGRKFNVLLRARMPLVEDPEVVGYVRDLVARIVQVMPPQVFPVTSSVVLADAMNAFAAPAGYLYVNTGLILNLDSEAELAGVLGHELAHISQRHIAQRIEQAQVWNLGALLGMIAGVFLGATGKGGGATEGLMLGPMAASQSAMLSYSRDNEREADQVGLEYILAAGFQPQGLVESFQKIKRLRLLSAGGGGGVPDYLSTHPGLNERIGYLDDRIRRLPAKSLPKGGDNDRFLRIQTIIRSRYADAEKCLAYYDEKANLTCLDRLGRAVALTRVNRLKDADADFQAALACGKQDPLWLREAGRFYYQRGDYAQAGRYLQEAVLKRSDDLMALFFYARLLGDSGQPNQAVAYLERVLKKLPEDAEVHSNLGRILGQKGDLFSAHLHLAYAAVYANNRKQAAFHMEKAKEQSRTQENKDAFEKLKKTHDERAEYW